MKMKRTAKAKLSKAIKTARSSKTERVVKVFPDTPKTIPADFTFFLDGETQLALLGREMERTAPRVETRSTRQRKALEHILK
ncbi:hypothetical protein [Agrococcus sp. ProA11]|uniref:hypothetical protein n=1 Tax=Agrococcus chionoecetis TaxID=3153752 RepID=UPI0032618549